MKRCLGIPSQDRKAWNLFIILKKRFEIIFYLAYRLKQILATLYTVGNGKKPGVHFGHDNDPLGSVCQELRRLIPHCRLRAVPRITAVLMSFFDLDNQVGVG